MELSDESPEKAFLESLEAPPPIFKTTDLPEIPENAITDCQFDVPLPPRGKILGQISADLPPDTPGFNLRPFLSSCYTKRRPTELDAEFNESLFKRRSAFIEALEDQRAREARASRYNAKKEELKRLISTGTLDDWRAFESKQHHKARLGLKVGSKWTLCYAEGCTNRAVHSSDFCVQHILMDRSQKLFTRCDTCGRPRLIHSNCFLCSKM